MLELKNITKIYNPGSVTQQCVFEDFSLTIPDSQFVSVVGSNGSGKTSLLNIICGSIPIQHGQVLIGGRDITKAKDFRRYAHIGRVYQNPSMGTCPNLSITENMALADNKNKVYGLSRGVEKKKINIYREMLSGFSLGLEEKMDSKVGALSGGQRQALSIVMATMTPIDFLILDEHTAALDPNAAELIMQFTDKVVREKKLTAIMVTHNLRYAVNYGDRIIMMDKGKAVLDKSGEEKKGETLESLLGLFTAISIECGN